MPVKPGRAAISSSILGIILHGTGAKGVETAVDAVDLLGTAPCSGGRYPSRSVPAAPGFSARRSSSRQCHGVHVTGGQDGTTAAGNALFKDQLHFASTSSTMAAALSSSALLTFSVAHHRMPILSQGQTAQDAPVRPGRPEPPSRWGRVGDEFVEVSARHRPVPRRPGRRSLPAR